MSVLAAGLAGHKGDKLKEKRGNSIMDVIDNGLACLWNPDKVLWPNWCIPGLVSCLWTTHRGHSQTHFHPGSLTATRPWYKL